VRLAGKKSGHGSSASTTMAAWRLWASARYAQPVSSCSFIGTHALEKESRPSTVWARQGGGAVQGYDSDAIGRRPGSARLGLCVLGAWREGKGSGRRCSDERDPLVIWNAAPDSPRGSRASASRPRGTTARATRGVGAAGAFQSASACETFSSSPV
jgi:hypothetical protein